MKILQIDCIAMDVLCVISKKEQDFSPPIANHCPREDACLKPSHSSPVHCKLHKLGWLNCFPTVNHFSMEHADGKIGVRAYLLVRQVFWEQGADTESSPAQRRMKVGKVASGGCGRAELEGHLKTSCSNTTPGDIPKRL
jgi:hypothetical protein